MRFCTYQAVTFFTASSQKREMSEQMPSTSSPRPSQFSEMCRPMSSKPSQISSHQTCHFSLIWPLLSSMLALASPRPVRTVCSTPPSP